LISNEDGEEKKLPELAKAERGGKNAQEKTYDPPWPQRISSF
jgi:hypothetical protein